MVITEPFQSVIASHAVKLGVPGYHSLTVPHPVWGKSEHELRAIVGPIADGALGQLLP